jgi:lysophospholipase L1-like esterase
MEKHWTMIWHQAMTRSFLNGKAYGRNKTAVFSIPVPASGGALRIRFSNRFGTAPYKIGALRVFAGGRSCPVTLGGQQRFQIPTGGVTLSDPCELPVQRGEEIQLRLYYPKEIIDCNMIEEEANLLPGDQTARSGTEALRRPLLAKLLGAYNAIPAIEAVELLTEEPARAIVAFGDSITAMSRWTKPLARRLDETWPGEYVLLNSGISGNCLLYERDDLLAPVFGEMGTKRFERDVLEISNLDTVIFALGVNDVSYWNERTAGQINLPAYQSAITDMVDALHRRGVRVCMQTITPRLGVARTMGRYDRNMEALRLRLNDWIRSAGIFDYVFDAEAVVREERPVGYYYAEGLHQGDHLHPNARGGRKLAEAFDLEKLTGKEA